jgi:hypothetical protein
MVHIGNFSYLCSCLIGRAVVVQQTAREARVGFSVFGNFILIPIKQDTRLF